jgi:hypothetical protein
MYVGWLVVCDHSILILVSASDYEPELHQIDLPLLNFGNTSPEGHQYRTGPSRE